MADTPNASNPVISKSRGATLRQATKYDTQYQTSSVMYPDDLMQETNNPYGGNYVIFYINVHEDSMLTKQEGAAFVTSGIPPRVRGELAGSQYSAATQEILGAAAGSAAFAAGGIAQKATGAVGADLSSNAANVTNVIAGAATGAAIISKLGKPNAEYKRQAKAIALYVPNEMSIGYNARWEEASLAGTQAMAAALENMGKALPAAGLAAGAGALAGGVIAKSLGKSVGKGAALGGALGGGAVLAGAAGSAAVDYGAGAALQTPGVGQMLAKSTGTAANPKKEQLFSQVDYRTFTFNYQFFPRSSEEARKVQDIIYEFKLHMHPEFRPGTNQFLYIYPSEFDIFYYQNGQENMNLHRHTSCVLESMQVSYSPNGIFATFEDGMPTQINMSLTFKELALLSKETIMDGY